MGDSITEGTIVEWTAQVGQAVNQEDVVALVETDKVTVEIKATMDGVITKQFGSVDDTVEVGGDLYEIDTEAEPTVEVGAASPPPAKETPSEVLAAAPSESPAAPPSVFKSRTPSIQFLGKQGWAALLNPPPRTVYIHPQYGRPAYTEEEMEALMLGGAESGPAIVQHSGGAKFQYFP